MSLKRKFALGVVWSTIGNGANNLISFIVFALVANVISPADLGVAALAIVLIEIGRQLSSAGLPDLLVQRPSWDHAYTSTAFWVSLAIGIVLTLVSWLAIAPAVEAGFAQGSGLPLAVVSLSLAVDALRVVSEAKLKREFNYRSLASRNTIAGIGSGIVSVWMALSGWGLWALIAQRLIHSVLMSVLTIYASGWLPKFTFARAELGPMLTHGLGLLAGTLLGSLASRIPELLVALLGPVALAFYKVGTRGFEALVQLVLYPVSGAALSGFSRIAETGGSLAPAYIRATQFAALFGYPIFFGAASIAEPFIQLAFGDKWEVSYPIMIALCLSIGPAIIGYMSRSALIASGMTRGFLWFSTGITVTTAVAALAGLAFGPFGVAVAVAIRAHVAAVYTLFMLKRRFGVEPRLLLAAILPPYLAAWGMVGVVVLVDHLLLAGQPGWLRMVVMVPVGGLAYTLTLLVFCRRYLLEALTEAAVMFPALERPLKRLGLQRSQDGGPRGSS